MAEFLNSEELKTLELISNIAEKNQVTLWVVGGVVRDLLIGIPQRLADIDLVVEGEAESLANKIADYFKVSSQSFPSFRTAKLRGIPTIDILDLASCRKEVYSAPGALPYVTAGTLKEDSSRRDFSVNALYIKLQDFIHCRGSELKAKVFNPEGGLADLDARRIRVLHNKSFIDDPTRLFRAIRYKIKISASFETDTASFFEKAIAAKAILTVSQQRIINELIKACEEQKWSSVISEFGTAKLLSEAKLLEQDSIEKFEKLFGVNTELIATEERYEFTTACLYFLSKAEEREERFRYFSFGKKFFKRMSELLDTNINKHDLVKISLRKCFEASNLTLGS